MKKMKSFYPLRRQFVEDSGLQPTVAGMIDMPDIKTLTWTMYLQTPFPDSALTDATYLRTLYLRDANSGLTAIRTHLCRLIDDTPTTTAIPTTDAIPCYPNIPDSDVIPTYLHLPDSDDTPTTDAIPTCRDSDVIPTHLHYPDSEAIHTTDAIPTYRLRRYPHTLTLSRLRRHPNYRRYPNIPTPTLSPHTYTIPTPTPFRLRRHSRLTDTIQTYRRHPDLLPTLSRLSTPFPT